MNNYQKNLLTKRFQTTMIGALFEFEKAFGYLWGHEKDINNLNEQECKFSDTWEEVRNNILNNGNKQLRKTISDLEYADNNIKYNYKFYPNKGDNK